MKWERDETLARIKGPHGQVRVDYHTIARLAGPLMLNSAIQSVLNLTDTWFISHLSTDATAAMASIYWPILCCILFFGGVAFSVQTFASQAMGGGRYRRASQAAWSGVAAALTTIPIFVSLALLGSVFLACLPISTPIQDLAIRYWVPRLLFSAPIGIMTMSLTCFFSSVNAVRYTLLVSVVTALANIPFNQWFMFDLNLGIAGSAWGTVAAQVVGLLLAFGLFLNSKMRALFNTHLTFRRPLIRKQWQLGIPMGFGMTADLIGLALFQLILVSTSALAGAASQIIMMLSSFAYMPGIGIAIAGTTFVGRSLGAHEPAWARTIGLHIIGICVGFMGLIGLTLALLSPFLLPWFIAPFDPQGPQLLKLMSQLIWIAAAYQFFDGFNLGSAFCLRGAEDAMIPAIVTATFSFGVWIPLTAYWTLAVIHLPGSITFAGVGLGAQGGWMATFVYVLCLGSGLFLRWLLLTRHWRSSPS
jgi:MATE family multidrug resistance protein